MENYTAENFEIVGQAMLKMAYNFWPVILFAVMYAVWETKVYSPSRVRPKSKTATDRRLNSQYSRDCAEQTGNRHL